MLGNVELEGSFVARDCSSRMAFTIDGGSDGLFGWIILLCAIGVGVILLVGLTSAARRARKRVIEDEGDDKDLIA